jgi:hypothetical protein
MKSDNGTFITDNRDVADFDGIVMQDIGHVIIQQSDQELLTVEAEAELMPKIISEVRNHKLFLKIGRDWYERIVRGMGFFHFEHLKYIVSMVTIHSLEISGAGQLEAARISTDTIRIEISGQGDVVINELIGDSLALQTSGQGNVQIAGNVKEASIMVSGSGDIDCSNCHCQKVSVNISGRGNVKVWADSDLEINISGMGNVTYSGNPRITQHISGLGEIIHLES